MKDLKQYYPYITAFILGALIFGSRFGLTAFQEPSQPPTVSNIRLPLNTGDVAQTKEGYLFLNSLNIDSSIRLGLDVIFGDVYTAEQGRGLRVKDSDGTNCHRLTVKGSGIVVTTPVSCIDGSDLGPPVSFTPAPATDKKIVFVSSRTYTGGAIGGVLLADAECQSMAQNAGIGGTFKAWLSDTAGLSPSTTFFRSPIPYRQVNDTANPPTAWDWADLVDGTIQKPINRNELGVFVSSFVWTGTGYTGDVGASLYTCKELTGQSWRSSLSTILGYYGLTSLSNSSWTNSGSVGCNSSFRIYCFQQ